MSCIVRRATCHLVHMDTTVVLLALGLEATSMIADALYDVVFLSYEY